MAKKYTCRTGTRRWPIHSFQNTLDLTAINAWILYKEVTKENISRKNFIRELAEEFAEPQVQKRNSVSAQVPFTINKKDDLQPKKFCQVKILCKRNCSVGVCIRCKKFLRGTCTTIVQRVCSNCINNLNLIVMNSLVELHHQKNTCECKYERKKFA